jgi:2-amino-4-hydroxy-6-hydroxymethyldihydropteridine diphosphokinase
MAGRYLIALGSNVRHHRYGRPRDVVRAAIAELAAQGMPLEAVSSIQISDPLGPSLRRYANAAAIVTSGDDPQSLLARLKRIERTFGRRPRGRRWGARVLDLDLILWDGGFCTAPGLTVPHPSFRLRRFVLDPAAVIAPAWRDPLTGLTVRQLRARLTRRPPLP